MTTKQAEWKKYTGSDEQIAEITNSKHGYVFRFKNGNELLSWQQYDLQIGNWPGDVKEYLIANPHPLAVMIIRQAQTGQPVWIKTEDWSIDVCQYEGQLMGKSTDTHMVFLTSKPDWNIPNAEYSFTPLED